MKPNDRPKTYSALGRPLRFAKDAVLLAQAQVAVRNKRTYLPSLFGHYTVNSSCNLRCSYCYVGQSEIFPEGFSNPGLPLDRAKRVLETLREECLFLRIQGGEPLLYKEINELVRFAKQDLRYRHVSIITNALMLAKSPGRFRTMLENLDMITISIDNTRRREYPSQMERVERFLPQLLVLCELHKISLSGNYTATWEELADPDRIKTAVDAYTPYFSTTYIMPVRIAGKTPLHLLKNSVQLNRDYSAGRYAGPEYPDVEGVDWYREHCDPKLKIKIDADGQLVYPCENHSYAAGSLEERSIKDIWTNQLASYPNESCMGCGKQRFRSYAFKRPRVVMTAARNLRRPKQPEILAETAEEK